MEEGPEGEGRMGRGGGRGRESSRFARIWGQISNAHNSKTVIARPRNGTLFRRVRDIGLETEGSITELAGWTMLCRAGTNGKLLG